MTANQPIEIPRQLLGRQIGDYRIISRLGRGGMAQVFLSEQTSLGRLVALKVLKAELAKDPSYIQRFKNEARAAAGLVHPNIVQIYEVGEDQGVHFIAQEYVAGMNLSQYLKRNGAAAPLMAVNVMVQIAAALKKASALGVVHRDIKPENIMLSTEGEVKVADFGLARQIVAGQDNHLTQIGVTMGTPLYMSPEQIEGGNVDHRADLYSFGISCYHMLVGQPPFQGDNPISVAIGHAKETAKPISDFRPTLPIKLIEIIDKLMAKKPADRYQDAGQVLDALRAVEVDSSTDDWQDLLKGLQTSAATVSHHSRLAQNQLAATRRLETLILEKSSKRRFSQAVLGAALCIVLPLAAGAAYAALTMPPSLIDQAANAKSDVKRANSIAEQSVFATVIGSEEAWLSVIEYYDNVPDSEYQISALDRLYIVRAKEQLAQFYVSDYERNEKNSPLTQRKRSQSLKKALAIYAEFRSLPTTETSSIAVGKYGTAYVKFQQGDPDFAKDLVGNKDELPAFMRSRWEAILREMKLSTDETQ